MSVAGDFSKDILRRQAFADRIASAVSVLATAQSTPGGRVLAVSAPWGSGKTWVAEKLPSHLAGHKAIGRCIYLNVFQFDYHSDPFAILASAILKECADLGEKTAELRKSALGVLRAATPALAREAAKAGAKLLGIDAGNVVDAISDAAGVAADKTLERLLHSVEETTKSIEAFRSKLHELSIAAGGPLVVVIDELDRCKPDFSLALLERMKHLFEVQGVVFVLFLELRALKSAIRHTYGDIDADSYLKKFVSIWMELPKTDSPVANIPQRSEFISRFIHAEYEGFIKTQQEQDFVITLTSFAPYFEATLRDVQNVMLLGGIAKEALTLFGGGAALLLLVKICDPTNFDLFGGDPVLVSRHEVNRLASRIHSVQSPQEVLRFFDMFSYFADPDKYLEKLQASPKPRYMLSEQECKDFWRWLGQVHGKLRIEHLKFS